MVQKPFETLGGFLLGGWPRRRLVGEAEFRQGGDRVGIRKRIVPTRRDKTRKNGRVRLGAPSLGEGGEDGVGTALTVERLPRRMEKGVGERFCGNPLTVGHGLYGLVPFCRVRFIVAVPVKGRSVRCLDESKKFLFGFAMKNVEMGAQGP
jgi:hypothetical protein